MSAIVSNQACGLTRAQRIRIGISPGDAAKSDAGRLCRVHVTHFVADRNCRRWRDPGALDDPPEFRGLAEERGAAGEIGKVAGAVAELQPRIGLAVRTDQRDPDAVAPQRIQHLGYTGKERKSR